MKNTSKYFTILAVIGVFVYLMQGTEKTREFNFKYNIELEPSNTKVEVWIPIPQTNEVQTVSNLSLSNKDKMGCTELTEENHKNKYYYCSVNNLEEETTLTLSVDVVRKEHSTVNYDGVNPDKYDSGTNNRTVQEGLMFESIINDEKLTKDNVDQIYEYVLSGMHYGKPKSNSSDDKFYSKINEKTNKPYLPDNIKYGRKKVTKEKVLQHYLDSKSDETKKEDTFANGNSVYACDIGVGNCTDYHSYFMSLCRTLDVPARFHMGFSIPNKDNETQGKVGGYHCWADYYTEDKGWTPVDISEADKDPSMAEYFNGTVNQHRVEFTVGRDLKLNNRINTENFFVYPIVEGANYEKSFSYKNL